MVIGGSMRIGILAYGSLIDEPGDEIEDVLVNRIKGVETPFHIEFARKSKSRNYAPTLIPVGTGGRPVQGVIFELSEGTTLEHARNILYRRETRNDKSYKHPVNPTENSVIIEEISDFNGLHVLYTKIGSNIEDLNAEILADLAINSAKAEAGKEKKDGISYLISAKQNNITTCLSSEYERTILKKTGTKTLIEAWEYCQK
ncbi:MULTISPECIES: hypothetical protein [Klebsiella]|uniref:hypothetical protein n=1 Tax=Klebsiella TaxID=570 RepID=UPI00292B07E1|nr:MULTISPECIES: hypothetical protein [Klebsiella]MDV1071758.1 hypothetical protein [Klebsiella pasteurii]MDV1077602.1 hypothetical protein [Klebsiella pasteurii]MEA8826963.1 hypothetical protein [Klebsiella aerogenes]HBR6978692.1 hypothetical protein [Klebsiella aerogenes]